MSIQESHSPKYWNYFLALEEDLIRLSRYIEFTESNYSAHSIEMAKILLSTCSEVDVIAKKICDIYKAKSNSIDDYKHLILEKINNFPATEIKVCRYGLTLTPWINWNGDSHPNWWRDHNKVKHHRHENFSRANLKNTLNAMAGLFCMVINYHLLKEEYPKLSPKPTLFSMPGLVLRAPGIWGDNID